MLPQVVEVVKNIHHISEVQALGVAANTDITQHTQQYVGVSQELKAQLTDLLASFKTNANRQPELRNLINIIERSLKAVDEWIRFPKLIEVPKEV